jgi:hypothetical protein
LTNPLKPYGFSTRTFPGQGNPSPDGAANEGADGCLFNGPVYANDAQIAGDFIAWLGSQPPSQACDVQVAGPGSPPASPWCAALSLINPHDIALGPARLQNPVPPANVPSLPVYYPAPPFGPLSNPAPLYTAYPAGWNYENLQTVKNKPGIQYAFQSTFNRRFGQVHYNLPQTPNWLTFNSAPAVTQPGWRRSGPDRCDSLDIC